MACYLLRLWWNHDSPTGPAGMSLGEQEIEAGSRKDAIVQARQVLGTEAAGHVINRVGVCSQKAGRFAGQFNRPFVSVEE